MIAGFPTRLLDSSVFVAVCAVRPYAVGLRRCLGALIDQGVSPVVFVSDSDTERQVAEETAGDLGTEVVGVPAPELAGLHNAALEHCAADVLALVDDDVVVEPGWNAELCAAWACAPAEVAAVGGPLALRVLGGAPRWWRNGPAQAFASHDYGERCSLDPTVETMHGGNLSFRSDALRGAEGFWPARARGDTRDWCSAVHHAQHALGLLGWRSVYEPKVGAHRLLSADRLQFGDVLMRRFRSAGRAAMLDGQSARRGALPRAVRSAAELARAPARRGDERRLVESSMALADSLGSLLAPLVAKHDFEPTGPTAVRP
ncbi:MAG: glycosyltransferase, partial [Acidobacteriota bacterium]|nr:glycosyltransferase [Acidobacteriota bacterium]